MKKFYGLVVVLSLIVLMAGCGGGGGGSSSDNPGGGTDTPGENETIIVEGQYKLSIKVTGKGQVETTKLEPYNGYTWYELQAVPDTGYHFLHWEGDDYNGIQNPLDEKMDKNISETAVFVDSEHFVIGTWDCYGKTEFTMTFNEDKTFTFESDYSTSTSSGTWYLDDDGDFIDIYFDTQDAPHYTGTIDFVKRKITGNYTSTNLGFGNWNATRSD